MSLIRNPAETDPLMNRSIRGDFPDSLEREVVDGGVREGRLESPHAPGLTTLVIILLLAFLALALAFKFIVYGFP